MKTINIPVSEDVVSDLLDAVRVRATVYCRSDMRAPWGFGVRAHGNPSFHVITHGGGWLEVDEDDRPRELKAGDLVVLPHGPTHWLRDRPGSPTLWLDDILESTAMDRNGRLNYGGEGERTELLCGSFVLEGDTANPILRELPAVIKVGGRKSTPAPWVAASLDLVGTITGARAPGVETVLARLADTMLSQALRIALGELVSADEAHGRALRDPRIATAVHLIHANPQQTWTVERLAAKVGYSRSAFASRFRKLVGESPMSYVTRTRLAVGATLLQHTSLSLGEVASRTGYSSEASFSRAFKRAFGLSPGAYRISPRDSAHS